MEKSDSKKSQPSTSSTSQRQTSTTEESKKPKNSSHSILKKLGLGKSTGSKVSVPQSSSSALLLTRSDINLPTSKPQITTRPRKPTEPFYLPQLSPSVPERVYISPIVSSASAGDLKDKKVTFNQLTLNLDALIPQQKKPVLWRKSLTYEIQDGRNSARIKESQCYLWHTQASLHSMYALERLNKIHALKRSQIILVRELFEEVLEPVFQQFLVNYPRDYRQAESFTNYLCCAVECVVDFDVYQYMPVVENSAMSGVAQYITFSAEQEDEEYLLWYRLSSAKMINALEFYKATPKPSIEKIALFIKENFNRARCDEIIQQLRVLSEKISIGLRDNRNKTANIDNILEQVKSQYLSLLKQLHKDSDFSKEVIAEIANQLSGETIETRRRHPTCTKTERDFFIPVNTPLCDTIATIIYDFAREHTSLFTRTPSLSRISPRKEGAITPRKESPRKESPRYQGVLAHQLAEKISTAMKSADSVLVETSSTGCKM